MAIRYQIFKQELDDDPLTRGYSSMTNAEVTVDLTDTDTGRTRNRTEMSASEVFNAIEQTAFNALSVTDKQLVWDILHLVTLNPFGLEATLFIDIFGSGTATIIALQAARLQNISKAEEIGIGGVKEGHVERVRGG
ncbi:hypothetical protein LCGC14_2164420 [marine sediment metagenome]|uniref:Uncharacterized protein n=1 Tax=marine sediment metagenome TaxID=412755 RepID=A0A0F9G4K1_9ZZZZ